MITPQIQHLVFDLLAVALALGGGGLVYRWRYRAALPATAGRLGPGYFLFLAMGSITGAYLFGTINMVLSDQSGIGRSILGALFGAIVTVEFYKWRRGTKGSTGYIYAVPFCILIIVGRLGCFASGLSDFTHGIPTGLAWAWDYGDGIPRHPVQLYESTAMLAGLVVVLALLWRQPDTIIRHGFYLVVGWYALQRFLWEFLKPYGEIGDLLNIFQLLCILLLIYSVAMTIKSRGSGVGA